MRGDPELTFTLKQKHNPEGFYYSESDESSTPKKMRRSTHAFDQFPSTPAFLPDFYRIYGDKSCGSTSGEEEQAVQSPGTPPIFSHRRHNAVQHVPRRRRKGIPHRSPLQ